MKTLILFVLLLFASVSLAQVNWTKYSVNPVLEKGSPGEWDDDNVVAPRVLKVAGTYHMWYDGNWDNPGSLNAGVGHATSEDGISWQKDKNNPVLLPNPQYSWESLAVTQVSVIYDDNDSKFHMWYSGYSERDYDCGIGHAVSTDGSFWEKDTLNNPVLTPGINGSWDDYLVIAPCVLKINNTYHMWYDGWADGNSRTMKKVGHATSSDGINWMKDINNPILAPADAGSWDYNFVRAVSVIYDGGTFHMWYTGGQWLTYDIGYAFSDDGSSWTKYNNPNTNKQPYKYGDPVIRRSDSAGWDSWGLFTCSVMLNEAGDSLKMWYSGTDNDFIDSRIGYAAAPAILYVPENYSTIQQAIDISKDGDVILVNEGTYYENINFEGKAITVASHFWMDGDTSHISGTIINGSKPEDSKKASVVTFDSGEDTTSVLDGFTISGGSGTFFHLPDWLPEKDGGGICINQSCAKIVNNYITNNTINAFGDTTATSGAIFIWCEEGYVVIRSNTISYNTVFSPKNAWAGASLVYSNGHVLFENNQFIANKTTGSKYSVGGAVVVDGALSHNGKTIIRSNVFKNNSTQSTRVKYTFGGAIYVRNVSPYILNNIISDNRSEYGGGIGIDDWSNLTNYAKPILINNTITRNKASVGGAVEVFGPRSKPVIINSILWGNSARLDKSDLSLLGNAQADVVYCDIKGGWTGEGNIDYDPLFYDAEAGDFRLMENSWCIGRGTDSVQINNVFYFCPNTCFAGTPRPNPVDGLVDMGALESPFVITAIEDPLVEIPMRFELKQNYPNPFNNSTLISYQLALVSDVQLSIYNLLGQKVTTLVDKKQLAGSYKVYWDAGNFSSGVYFYTMNTDQGFKKTKKLILLK